MAVKYLTILVYMVALLAIGWSASRRLRNVGDFVLAGRHVGPWLSAFAYGTTYFSAVLFVGYAGRLGWGFGLNTFYIVFGNVLVGCLLAWGLLARPTRQMTARLDALTMPEFLAGRYDCAWLRPAAAVVVFVFLVPYSASVYQGLGYLVESNLGLPYWQAQLLMAAITGVYLAMGGYRAVAWTELFQGVLQIFGVVVMVLLLAAPFGGPLAALSRLAAEGRAPALAAEGLFPGWLILASLVVITSLGVFGLPQMVQKFYAIKSVTMVRPAMIVSAAFALLIAGSAYFTGAMTHLFFPPGTVHDKPDQIIPNLLAAHTPEWFSTLILLVVLAASMSTLASLVLVSSAALSVDLLGLRTRGDEADARGILVLRLLCGVFVGLSVWLAISEVTFIVNLRVVSWGALAGAFLAPYVYGLYWRRASAAGAVAAAVVGLLTSVGLGALWGKDGVPVAGALAMLLPLGVLPVVSLATRPPAPELVERLFAEGDDE